MMRELLSKYGLLRYDWKKVKLHPTYAFRKILRHNLASYSNTFHHGNPTMSLSNQPPPKELIRLGILIHTAIAGASFAAVIQLASRENLDQALILSIFCFAIAIPASVAMVFISQLVIPEGMKFSKASQMETKRLPLLSYLIPLAEQLSFFVGVLALFWSFHPVASLLLLVASFLAFLAVKLVEKGV
jgi:hypothetical protein